MTEESHLISCFRVRCRVFKFTKKYCGIHNYQIWWEQQYS